MQDKIAKLNIRAQKLLKTLNIAFVVFFIFAASISTLMELDIIKYDIGPIHKYISNFNAREVSIVIFTSGVLFWGKLKRLFITFRPNAVVCIMFFSFFLDTIGNLFGWYSIGREYSIARYDDFTHFFNSVLLTIALYIALSVKATVDLFKKYHGIIIALSMLMVFGAGTLFEIYEYISDRFLSTYMVGGIDDTMTDIIYNLLGLLIGGFLARFIPLELLLINTKKTK